MAREPSSGGGPVAAFYDSFADSYHLLWPDWWEAALRHGRLLAGALEGAGIRPPARVLDCSCGIGTQTLGLAEAGYTMTGSDLSAGAVARARREAAAHGHDGIRFLTADMRAVDTLLAEPFDAVVSADNSLPHLATDADLADAVGAIGRCLRPGGIFLATVRDYDALLADRPTGMPPYRLDDDHGQRIIGQSWDWAPDGAESLTIRLFLLREKGDGDWSCQLWTAPYRALRRQALTDALAAGGFTGVTWTDPSRSGFYQPIVTASRV